MLDNDVVKEHIHEIRDCAMRLLLNLGKCDEAHFDANLNSMEQELQWLRENQNKIDFK
jgi:Icc-related predicted phosphoesterase